MTAINIFQFLSLGVVVPGGPAGVHLHVQLPLLPRRLVVLGLLLPRQRVPLQHPSHKYLSS